MIFGLPTSSPARDGLRGRRGGSVVAVAIAFVALWWMPAAVASGQEVPEALTREIQQLQEAVTKDPANRQLRGDLARRLSWARRFDESVAEYRRLLEEAEDLTLRAELARVLSWAGPPAPAGRARPPPAAPPPPP